MIILIHVTLNGKQGVLTRTHKATSVITFPDGTEQRIPNSLLVVRPTLKVKRAPKRTEYFTHSTKTAAGYRAVDTDDQVARELRGLSLDRVYELAAIEADWSLSALQANFEGKSPAIVRMHLGHIIRKARRT